MPLCFDSAAKRMLRWIFSFLRYLFSNGRKIKRFVLVLTLTYAISNLSIALSKRWDNSDDYVDDRAIRVNRSRPWPIATKLEFQRLGWKRGNALYRLFFYSAWFDPRLPKQVRVIGISQAGLTPASESVLCVFQRPANSFMKAEHIEMHAIDIRRIHWYHPASISLTCPSTKSIGSYSDWSVAICVAGINTSCTNYALPINLIKIEKERKLFGMCVQPLHSGFKNVHKLIEMIEVNRLLGADRIYIYNNSVSNAVSRVLHYYQSQTKIVEVLPWQIDAKVFGEESAQMAALADCQRRLMQRFVYLISTDLDDFIVPRSHRSWVDFHRMVMSRRPEIGQFIFPNIYFIPDHAFVLHVDPDVKRYRLNTLLATTRFEHALPHKERSKVIARSECIDDHYIHVVERFLETPSCRRLNDSLILPSVGILHHYRSVLPAQTYPTAETLNDMYFFELFKAPLITAVKTVHAELENFD